MFDQKAFINFTLYIAHKLKEMWVLLTETKLYKLLWFTSIALADEQGSLLLQDVFLKRKFWPVPEQWHNYIDSLKLSETKQDEDIKIKIEFDYPYEYHIIEPLREYDESYFTESDKKALDKIIDKYWRQTASELSGLSHDTARNEVDNYQVIDITKDMKNEYYKDIIKEQYLNIIWIINKIKYAI